LLSTAEFGLLIDAEKRETKCYLPKLFKDINKGLEPDVAKCQPISELDVVKFQPRETECSLPKLFLESLRF
jgi:hypothetical protein